MVRRNSALQEIDYLIGEKIHSLRIERGWSRDKLAKSIGVSHQQLQKYEKGTNRISASRILLIAKSLSMPVDYFYQGLDERRQEGVLSKHQRITLEVSKNFRKIHNSRQRAAISVLVKSLVQEST